MNWLEELLLKESQTRDVLMPGNRGQKVFVNPRFIKPEEYNPLPNPNDLKGKPGPKRYNPIREQKIEELKKEIQPNIGPPMPWRRVEEVWEKTPVQNINNQVQKINDPGQNLNDQKYTDRSQWAKNIEEKYRQQQTEMRERITSLEKKRQEKKEQSHERLVAPELDETEEPQQLALEDPYVRSLVEDIDDVMDNMRGQTHKYNHLVRLKERLESGETGADEGRAEFANLRKMIIM